MFINKNRSQCHFDSLFYCIFFFLSNVWGQKLWTVKTNEVAASKIDSNRKTNKKCCRMQKRYQPARKINCQFWHGDCWHGPIKLCKNVAKELKIVCRRWSHGKKVKKKFEKSKIKLFRCETMWLQRFVSFFERSSRATPIWQLVITEMREKQSESLSAT